MRESLGVGWRLFATALAGLAFTAAAGALGLVILPLMRACTPSAVKQLSSTQTWIHKLLGAWLACVQALGLITVEIHGAAKLQRRGLLVLPNHPSLLDALILLAITPRADCLVKQSLIDSWIVGPVIRAAGFHPNGRPQRLIADCIASLRYGNNVVIFPEGTRTPWSGEMRLLRGAALVALRGHVAVTPVRVRCNPPLLQKGQRWFKVPTHRPHFRIDVGDDMAFGLDGESESRATRRLNAALVQFFCSEPALMENAHA